MNLEELTQLVNYFNYDMGPSYKVIEGRQKTMLHFFKPSFQVKNFTQEKILNYFNHLKARGLKPATINSKMMYLSKCLNYAYDTKVILSKFKIPYIKIKKTRRKIATEEEIQAMLEWSLNQGFKELYQALIIGYNTGIRISNILSILPEDIDNNYIRVWENKTNEPYSIPMNNTLKELFKDYQPFTLNYRQLHYQFQTMIKDLNLDSRITFHTLRHSFCSRLIEKNVALPVIQDLMNHKSIQTTMLYKHIKNTQLEEAVNML